MSSHSQHPCAHCGGTAWGTLCKTCYEELKPVEHGTQRLYRRGCKCQECVSGATYRRSERKKKQRAREQKDPKRLTTITINWGNDISREQAEEISRRVAREISKFKGVLEAHVAGAPSERERNAGANPVREVSGRPVVQDTTWFRGASGNGELDLSNVPSFKSRGKGKSLTEVVNSLK